MTLREEIAKAIVDIPRASDLDEDGSPGDEIVEAIVRQLDVLEGTAVVLSNMVQMLHLQVANLRAEVGLFSEPGEESEQPERKPGPERLPSGAVIEHSLPVEKRLPDFCLHDDALIVQTTDGPQRVCPDCEEES